MASPFPCYPVNRECHVKGNPDRKKKKIISVCVGTKNGPFANKDFWGDVKFKQGRFVAFWSGPFSLARTILLLFFFFTDISYFEKLLFLDRFF